MVCLNVVTVINLEMTAFTLKRAPSKSVETTPYELWFGKKPKLCIGRLYSDIGMVPSDSGILPEYRGVTGTPRGKYWALVDREEGRKVWPRPPPWQSELD